MNTYDTEQACITEYRKTWPEGRINTHYSTYKGKTHFVIQCDGERGSNTRISFILLKSGKFIDFC